LCEHTSTSAWTTNADVCSISSPRSASFQLAIPRQCHSLRSSVQILKTTNSQAVEWQAGSLHYERIRRLAMTTSRARWMLLCLAGFLAASLAAAVAAKDELPKPVRKV